MYAKLENNTLKYAPHYLILNNKTILNPQGNDYINAGYKEVVYSLKPDIKEGYEIIQIYSRDEDKIYVTYSLKDSLLSDEAQTTKEN